MLGIVMKTIIKNVSMYSYTYFLSVAYPYAQVNQIAHASNKKECALTYSRAEVHSFSCKLAHCFVVMLSHLKVSFYDSVFMILSLLHE